ncbi:cell adhesion molecule CEACAM5-like [Mixophyes fleayi]|uniref:cell adhesion molecule CEACAM5-like n=1 Tax=Mixophyes fleayi TaxID=3061075 RepID=UPI003F4DD42F
MDLYKCYLPCMLLLVIVSGAVSDGTVLNGILGGSVLFNVSVPSETFQITWNTNNVPIAQAFTTGGSQCLNQFMGRCELFMNGSLRLDGIRQTDQEEYTVTAQLQNITIIETKKLQLNIYTLLNPPVLKFNSTYNTTPDRLVGGSNVTLHCDAGSQTVLTYTFYRDQKTICSEPHVTCRDSVLNFQPITETDSGTYICTTQNPVSTNTSNSLQLTVIVPVSEVTLTTNTSDSLVWPGKDSVSLRCSARGTDVSFSWRLQGAPLPLNPRYNVTNNSSILIISPVSATDNGSFTCTAKNVINNITSNEVTLNLASPVSDVRLSSNTSALLIEGEDSVSLHCSAQGSAVSFSWILNGEPLPQSPHYHITGDNSPPNSNLTISPVSRNDNGPFICRGSNLANNESSNTLSLDLAWRPTGNISCTTEVYKQLLQLNCSWPGGQPAANVTMIYNNVTEINYNQVIRNLTSNNNVQGSILTCNGDQLGKTSSCTLTFESPQSPGHDNGKITEVTEGNAAVMTVNLRPGHQDRATTFSSQVLPATFSWARLSPNPSPIQDGGKFKVNSTEYTSNLEISDVTKDENGKYECRAENVIGSTTFTFTLNVEAKPVSKSGLSGGEIAGIVIGALAGVVIIGIIVFFIVKRYVTKTHLYENSDIPPPHIYETTIKGVEMEKTKSTNQNPHYETLIRTDGALYSNVTNVSTMR